MSLELAQRVLDVGTETAFEVDKKARALDRELKRKDPKARVVFAHLGEPNFNTAPHICAAAQRSIANGEHHYGPAPGQPALREAIAQTALAQLGLSYDVEETLVLPGAKPFILFTLMTCVDPGTEVLIPDPGYSIYESATRLIGAVPVRLPLREENGFQPDPDELAALVTDRTRLIILNSPHNPIGSVLDHDSLRRIAEIALRHGLWVLSDEVYNRIIYDGSRHLSIAQIPGMREQTVVMNGVSKTFAMTGWRLGFGCMPRRLAERMTKLAINFHSCTSLPVQAAGVAALTGPQDCVTTMVSEFERRRDVIVSRLNDIPGISCRRPSGAFYALANVTGVTDNCERLADQLLYEGHVSSVAGSYFGPGGAGYLRFSYATSIEEIEEAMRRFRAFLSH